MAKYFIEQTSEPSDGMSAQAKARDIAGGWELLEFERMYRSFRPIRL